MIQDHTIDQTIIELARTMKALKALRAARKGPVQCLRGSCAMLFIKVTCDRRKCSECNDPLYEVGGAQREHAAATRASMDLTRKLADLRQGR